MARSATADPQLPSALARLLETEARLEARLAAARERADGLRLGAERQAQALAAALETELAEAAALAAGRRSAECSERLAALARDNDLALARLRTVGPARIGELARWVSGQVLERALEPGP